MMYLSQGIVFVSLIAAHILYAQDDVLGCGGFVKNNNAGAELDLTQVKVFIYLQVIMFFSIDSQ